MLRLWFFEFFDLAATDCGGVVFLVHVGSAVRSTIERISVSQMDPVVAVVLLPIALITSTQHVPGKHPFVAIVQTKSNGHQYSVAVA